MLILSNNYHKDWKTIIVKYLGDLINDMFRLHKRYVYDPQTICLFLPSIIMTVNMRSTVIIVK